MLRLNLLAPLIVMTAGCSTNNESEIELSIPDCKLVEKYPYVEEPIEIPPLTKVVIDSNYVVDLNNEGDSYKLVNVKHQYFNQDGRLINSFVLSTEGDTVAYENYLFDQQGVILEQNSRNSMFPERKQTRLYDKGILIKVCTYENDSLTWVKVIQHPDAYTDVYVRDTVDGAPSDTVVVRYDQCNRYIGESYSFPADRREDCEVHVTYDTAGRKSTYTWNYINHSSWSEKVNYEYNASNLLSKETRSTMNNGKESIVVESYQYEYDKTGYWIKKETYNEGSLSRISYRFYLH